MWSAHLRHCLPVSSFYVDLFTVFCRKCYSRNACYRHCECHHQRKQFLYSYIYFIFYPIKHPDTSLFCFLSSPFSPPLSIFHFLYLVILPILIVCFRHLQLAKTISLKIYSIPFSTVNICTFLSYL